MSMYERIQSYEFEVTLLDDGAGAGSGTTPVMPEDVYLSRFSVVGTNIAVAGTVNLKTQAKTGAAAVTVLQDAVVTSIDISPYALVQDAAGANIAGEYNQRFIRKGEKLDITSTVMGGNGTMACLVQVTNKPNPVTR